MDLNDIRMKNYGNPYDFMKNDDAIVPKKSVENNIGHFDAENQFSTDEQNYQRYHQQGNFLFFHIITKKSIDENEKFAQKINAEPHFLTLIETKEEDGRVLLVHERPHYTLTNFLLNNKIDNSLRLLLFKQGLQIIFKLISLDKEFSFFNYNIFFVEDYRRENDIDCVFYDYESTLRMKIYYHVEIKEYLKENHLTSRSPYHWIFYLFCSIFKEFSTDFNLKEEENIPIENHDYLSIPIMKKIYAFLCERYRQTLCINNCFKDFLNMLNPILKYHGIQEIYQFDTNKEYLSYIDFRFDINKFSFNRTLDFLTLPISINKAVKFIRNLNYIPKGIKNSADTNAILYSDNHNYIKNQKNFSESNYQSIHNSGDYGYSSNKCNYHLSQNKFEDYYFNNEYNGRNLNHDPNKINKKIDIFSQPIQNDFTKYSRYNANLANLEFNITQETSRNNNVYNINNYFQITDRRSNINVGGNLKNCNYIFTNQSNCNFTKKNYLNEECNNYGYSNGDISYNEYYIDKKLREYESNSSFFYKNNDCFNSVYNSNIDYEYGLNNNFLWTKNQEKSIYSNNHHNENFATTDHFHRNENEFLGIKRDSSKISQFNTYFNDNYTKFCFENLTDKSNRTIIDGVNKSTDYILNLNENHYFKNNPDRSEIHKFDERDYCNQSNKKKFNCYEYDEKKKKTSKEFVCNTTKTIISHDEINEKSQILNGSKNKKEKSFEIKKDEKHFIKKYKREIKSNCTRNIFNIENVPKLNKSHSLISSMKLFNDISIKNNDISINSGKESQKSLLVYTETGFKILDGINTHLDDKNLKKDAKSDDSFKFLFNKISCTDRNMNDNQFTAENKEDSVIIRNIFNDYEKVLNENNNQRCFSINKICSDFNNNFNISVDNVSNQKERIEKSNTNVEKDNKNVSKIIEKISDPNKKLNNVFSITKKICMNNVRSRLGNIINFKRRKLSIENVRKKSNKKPKKLTKEVKEDTLNKEIFLKVEKFQNALIDINEQKIILNKNILKNFLNEENFFNGDELKLKSKKIKKDNDKGSSSGSFNIMSSKRKTPIKKDCFSKIMLRKNKMNHVQGESEVNNFTKIDNLNNSNNSNKIFIEEPKKHNMKINKLSRKLSTDKKNLKIESSKSIHNLKKVNNKSFSSSKRLSRNSTINFKELKSSTKILKSKMKNMFEESNINYCEYLNDKNFSLNKFNQRINSKSERYGLNKEGNIEDKIRVPGNEIDDFAQHYLNKLESNLLDKRHLFMKNNFPSFYEKQNFFSIKGDNMDNTIANHSKIPEMFDFTKKEKYVKSIIISLLDFIHEKSDKLNWAKIIRKYNFIIKNKTIDSDSGHTEKGDNSINCLENNTIENIANNLINSETCLKTTDSYQNKMKKKEENNFYLSKQNLLNKYSNLKTQDSKNNLISEDILTCHIQSEDLFTESDTKTKNENLQLENPLLPIRLWSPHVLNDDQILNYYKEAGKTWPRRLNWSEDVALNLLNKFDYNIENTLHVLKNPVEEIISYIKANLNNKLWMNSCCKNRSRRSRVKQK